MNLVKRVLSKLYVLWVLIVFTVFMFFFLPVIILPILLGQKYGNITYAGLTGWSWVFSRLTFIGYEIIGSHHVNTSKSYIYTSNHTSFLDVPGLTLGIPTQFRPLAKKELLKIPVFGLIVKVAGIIVDRSSNESRKNSVKMLINRLRQGISILIFPEGTQNRSSEPLQPFYDGAFRIAVETRTPILPMVIVNAGTLMPPGTLTIKPGKIKVVFGKEIDVENVDLKDVKKLKEQVFNDMQQLLANHSF